MNKPDNPIPQDIVPRGGVSDETLLWLHDRAGTDVEVSFPGEVICDVDGVPIGVEAPQRSTATLADPVLTADERARLERLLAQRKADQ